MAETIKGYIVKWAQPAIVIALVTTLAYGVAWGVQLNEFALSQARITSALTERLIASEANQNRAALINARLTSVQDALIRQQDILERRMTRNESWISDNRNNMDN